MEITPLKKSVCANVRMPGSKSYTNRALILAALTQGPVCLKNPLYSEDTQAMIDCLRTLGLNIQTDPDQIVVHNAIDCIEDKNYHLFARDSGTTVRFMLALLCIVPGIKILQGSKRLNERPISDLIDALQELGAGIEYCDKEGQLPVKITTSTLLNHSVHLKGDLSSQFCSALLLISPYILKGLTIHIIGSLISKPYIDMTLNSMQDWGVNVEVVAKLRVRRFWGLFQPIFDFFCGGSIRSLIQPPQKKSKIGSKEPQNRQNLSFATTSVVGNYFIPEQQSYRMKHYAIEGDFSSAGYFFAIAVLTKSTITLENLIPSSCQADRKFLEILAKMGNSVSIQENTIRIQGKQILPSYVDMEDCPDQVMTMAVLAAFAKGVTKISGVRSLRVKETERVLALKNELGKMGIQTEDTPDTLTIFGGSPHAAEIDTYNDHRIAMAFAVAGTYLPGIVIHHPEVVNKTFPTFWDVLRSLG